MGRVTSNFLAPPLGPWGGVEGQISFNFNYTVNFKDFFIPNCVCVLTNNRYKTYQTGFSFCRLDYAPGVRLWGASGAQGVIFFQIWLCGISNRRGWRAELNASNIFILGSSWWPWGEVKGQISLYFGNHVNFKDFYTKLCVCSHKWKIQKHIRRDFYSVAWVMPKGWDLRALGCQGGHFF